MLLADRTIEALADEHDSLADAVADLSEDELSAPSGAVEWTVAQVLSHLGSGAEITLAGLQAALGQRDAPGEGFNSSVWDRWNAMTPGQQRAGFLEQDTLLVAAFTALDEDQRATSRLQVGFGPAPLSVAAVGGLRLHEVAQHSWDVRAARDVAAAIRPGSAEVLAELFATEIGFMLGFIGKPGAVPELVRLDLAGSGYGLVITDPVRLVAALEDPTATFTGRLEAAIRLIGGRLRPEFTPADLRVSGNVTLEQLRAVFPGF